MSARRSGYAHAVFLASSLGTLLLVIAAFVVLTIALYVWFLVDLLRRPVSGATKVVWILAVAFFHVLGMIAYLLMRPSMPARRA